MKKILLLLVIGLIITSCTNSNEGDIIKDTRSTELTNKEFYLSKMKEKNFQLVNNGHCDDASEVTIQERSIVYLESNTLTDLSAIIEFKFIDACCQEFLGDYSIENDTLKFKYEQVNNEACACLCWYRYKLTINEPKEKYKAIKIEEK